jgi:hypothetical protein
MRHIVASVLFIGCLARPAAPLLAQGPGKPPTSACSLLTKGLVMQVTPYDKQALEVVMQIPPSEDAVGRSGSACEYGGIHLQVDPFTAETFERARQKTWLPVRDVGDAAYFRDNGGQWAELYIRTGVHVFTIQMDVPTGNTAESVKPNVIALARAILPKLR